MLAMVKKRQYSGGGWKQRGCGAGGATKVVRERRGCAVKEKGGKVLGVQHFTPH
jgi:hypothetical protein